jgi:hypothetical protein
MRFKKLLAAMGLAGILLANEAKAQWGTNIDLNLCDYGPLSGPCSAGPQDLVILKEHKFDKVRWSYYWNVTNPTPEKENYTRADAQFKAFRDQDMKVFATFGWAPAWVTAGKPWLEPWQCMDKDHPGKFDESELCLAAKASDYNSAALAAKVDEFIYRYAVVGVDGRVGIKAISFDNERNYGVFWPPDAVDRSDAVQRKRMKDYLLTVTIPGVIAVRKANAKYGTNVEVIGVEEDNPVNAKLLLELERELAPQFPELEGRIWDVIAGHPYGDMTGAQTTIDTSNWFLNTVEPYRKGRRVDFTEYSITSLPGDEESMERQAVEVGKMIDHFRELMQYGTLRDIYDFRGVPDCIVRRQEHGKMDCQGYQYENGFVGRSANPTLKVYKEKAGKLWERKRGARR